MKPLSLLQCLLAVSCFAAITTISRIHAQDNNQPAELSVEDKWAKALDNNQKLLKSLEVIEQNLNFIKARSMSGGRSS